MAILDFIKNRGLQQLQPDQPKPETAKEMYTREAAQEKASQAPISLSPEAASSAAAAKDLFRQGTQVNPQENTSPGPVSQEGATNPQPMAQMSMNQGNAAPAQSPTSAQNGTRSNEEDRPVAPADTPSKSPDQTKKTMARTPPSWER